MINPCQDLYEKWLLWWLLLLRRRRRRRQTHVLALINIFGRIHLPISRSLFLFKCHDRQSHQPQSPAMQTERNLFAVTMHKLANFELSRFQWRTTIRSPSQIIIFYFLHFNDIIHSRFLLFFRIFH